MGESKQKAEGQPATVVSSNSHSPLPIIKKYRYLLCIILIIVLAAGAVWWRHTNNKNNAAKVKSEANAFVQQFDKNKNNPQATAADQLPVTQKQLAATPATQTLNRLQLYIEAATLAAQLKKPIAVQYANDALKLFPIDNTRQYYTSSIKAMQVISKANYGTHN